MDGTFCARGGRIEETKCECLLSTRLSSGADWGSGRQSSTIDFALCLGATATEKLAARTKIKNTGPLEKKDEVVANVIWRFLELRG